MILALTYFFLYSTCTEYMLTDGYFGDKIPKHQLRRKNYNA